MYPPISTVPGRLKTRRRMPRKPALVASVMVLAAALGNVFPASAAAGDCVILLHGLIRTSRSMAPMEAAFEARGYRVANIDYPSRKEPVELLAGRAINEGLTRCGDVEDGRVHFVTHSLGGILLRYYLAGHEIPKLGRIVMLAPPNNGSEAVDNLKSLPGFELALGPAGLQLGTDPHSIPAQLGPLGHPVGIIAGTNTFNPLLSRYLPDPDDGKVSVASTRLEDMTDFVSLPVSHPFIMRDETAIRQAIVFVETGAFVHDTAH